MSTRESIADRIAAVRPALDALRFFVATTRGFRDREQKRLALFLKEIAPLDDYSVDEVAEWLKTKAGWIDTHDYRRGHTAHYQALLEAIPAHLLARTRDYATLIAGGSGRKRLDPELEARIDAEFSVPPRVIAPTPPEDDSPGLEIRITL